MKKAAIVLIAVVLLALTLLGVKLYEFYRSVYSNGKGTSNQKVLEKTSYSILIMGYGGEGHEGPFLTDTMMVANVDLKKKKVVLLSIPRDIWVKIPTKSKQDFYTKINSVYQMALYNKDYPDLPGKYGGEKGAIELLKLVIKETIGQTVDYYVAIDFSGFKKAVDILGGVDVKVEKTFDDYEYPLEGKKDDLCEKNEQFALIKDFITPPYDEEARRKLFAEKPELEGLVRNATEEPNLVFPCRYEHLHFDAGLIHMDGETALKYVRSRHSAQDGNDFGRAARQQRFLEAVKDKVISIGFIPKIIPLLDEMKGRVKTNMDIPIIQKFLKEADNVNQYTIKNIVLSDQDYLTNSYSTAGGYILVPRDGMDSWNSIQTYIRNVINGITPTPLPPTATPSAHL